MNKSSFPTLKKRRKKQDVMQCNNFLGTLLIRSTPLYNVFIKNGHKKDSAVEEIEREIFLLYMIFIATEQRYIYKMSVLIFEDNNY